MDYSEKKDLEKTKLTENQFKQLKENIIKKQYGIIGEDSRSVNKKE